MFTICQSTHEERLFHGAYLFINTSYPNSSVGAALVSGYLQKLESSQWPISTGLDIGKSGKNHFSKADH
jgi:hypothetical protein